MRMRKLMDDMVHILDKYGKQDYLMDLIIASKKDMPTSQKVQSLLLSISANIKDSQEFFKELIQNQDPEIRILIAANINDLFTAIACIKRKRNI